MSSFFARLGSNCARLTSSEFRSFSWVSKLGKDPELRLKKIEALNRRYALRRLGELPDDETKLLFGEPVFSHCRKEVKNRIEVLTRRLRRLSNIKCVDREDLEQTSVGNTNCVREYVSTIMEPNPRCAIIVMKDKGNTERIFKSIKAKHPNLIARLMDQERIEVSLPRITTAFREFRGELVNTQIFKAKFEMRRLELQCYRELESMTVNETEFSRWKVRVESEIKRGNEILDTLLKSALDDLDLETP